MVSKMSNELDVQFIRISRNIFFIPPHQTTYQVKNADLYINSRSSCVSCSNKVVGIVVGIATTCVTVKLLDSTKKHIATRKAI